MEEKQWILEASEKIKRKIRNVAESNRHKIPYTTENGRYDDWTDKNICWWTNGFWGGMMWQLYHATGEELYCDVAKEVEKKLDKNLMNYMGMDHDSGFKWLPTSVANYRISGSGESFNRAMLAANNLAGRFNPAGGFIRAWNDDGDGSRAGWAIIDCMMNLPLLYWAGEQTNDPRYGNIARAHADTAIKYFLRQDASVNHIVEFNSLTGEYVRSFGGQGYGEGSSWTRGQAWAIYGFALSYIHTKEIKYLKCAQDVARYFIASIPDEGFIPVDFRQPQDCKWEDSTAAAIAVCGMLEIADNMDETQKTEFMDAALRILRLLVDKRCNWSDECDNILEKCTAAFHDDKHEFAIVYGDYFLIEAIWKLTGQEIFIW